MGSYPSPAAGASPAFLEVFRRQADAGGTMSFAEFMRLALYDPAVGYYRRSQPRVGTGPGTDFFTSSTSGALFGELVVAAAVKLLDGAPAGDFTFVELGAEPGDPTADSPTGILAGVPHPFRATQAVGFGPLPELAGPCIVFSNELFDAQPFQRFVFHRDRWREIGVQLRDGALATVDLGTVPALSLPAHVPEGYIIDAPTAARALADAIAAQPWTGLFLAADYGKTWRELVDETPEGTARAYFRHTQSNDLLARPGEQDLTCHICWDWLAETLTARGFTSPEVQSQESFFIHHSGDAIAAISRAEAARFSRKKLSLLQLLHPAQMGQKFQVMHATRGLAR